MKVVALTAEMADIKVKLRCSQEQFVDMLQKYYTQQLVQLEDPDAVPDWVMLSFRNELSQIFKDFKGYPKITQGQWIRILKTALQDAQSVSLFLSLPNLLNLIHLMLPSASFRIWKRS